MFSLREGLDQLRNHVDGKPNPEAPQEHEAEEDTEYEVELVKSKRTKKGKDEYLVKWKGFDDPKEDTWETLKNLQGAANEAIKKFEKSKDKNKKPKVADKTEEDKDPYKRTLYQVTPSRRQLNRGESPSKIEAAKHKNKNETATRVTGKEVENKSNRRQSRAERRGVEEEKTEKSMAKQFQEQVAAEKKSAKRKRVSFEPAPEPEESRQKKSREEAQRKENLLFGKPPSKPIKVHLHIELELEEEQLVRLAQQLPGLLSMARRT